MSQKFNMAELLPVIDEAFNRGLDFKLPITGTSMTPLLIQGRDYVRISKPDFPLKPGDIPFYRRSDGSFVLHRIIRINDNGEYILCGDNQFLLENNIFESNIIGVATKLIIDGKEIDVEADNEYLKYKEKYLKNINTRYPIRRLKYTLYRMKNGK